MKLLALIFSAILMSGADVVTLNSSRYQVCYEESDCTAVQEATKIVISDNMIEVSNSQFTFEYKIVSSSALENGTTVMEVIEAAGSLLFVKKTDSSISFHFGNVDNRPLYEYYLN